MLFRSDNEEGKMKNEESSAGIVPAESAPPESEGLSCVSFENEEVRRKNEELPDGKADNSSFFLHNSSLDEDSEMSDHPPDY